MTPVCSAAGGQDSGATVYYSIYCIHTIMWHIMYRIIYITNQNISLVKISKESDFFSYLLKYLSAEKRIIKRLTQAGNLLVISPSLNHVLYDV